MKPDTLVCNPTTSTWLRFALPTPAAVSGHSNSPGDGRNAQRPALSVKAFFNACLYASGPPVRACDVAACPLSSWSAAMFSLALSKRSQANGFQMTALQRGHHSWGVVVGGSALLTRAIPVWIKEDQLLFVCRVVDRGGDGSPTWQRLWILPIKMAPQKEWKC